MNTGLLSSSPLADRHVALRAQTDADADFIKALYASTRWQELSVTGWPEELKHAFLRQQLDLQTRHYLSHYSGILREVILLEDNPVGRLYRWANEGDLRIVDLSILPAQRGRGIGTRILQAVIREAAQSGQSTSLHVGHDNPARFLYERLGFSKESGGDATHQFMRFIPASGNEGET